MVVCVNEAGADDVSGGIDLFLGGDGIGGDFDDAVAFDGWDPKSREFEMSDEFFSFSSEHYYTQQVFTHPHLQHYQTSFRGP
jgi:hypothetical protein